MAEAAAAAAPEAVIQSTWFVVFFLFWRGRVEGFSSQSWVPVRS